MATFETVATFNDKKNGNSNKVSVNIAMLPLKKKLMKKQITSHLAAGAQIIKVCIFWEGHKILRNLHLTFVYSTYRQK